MSTILLADTDPKIAETVHDAEALCHDSGLGIYVHYKGEDIGEVLEMLDVPLVVFTPRGKLTLDDMIKKYGGNAILAVGGFTEERELPKELIDRADDTVSLGPEFLAIPDVISGIIAAYKSSIQNRHEDAGTAERGSE